jgi:hypothetical protein
VALFWIFFGELKMGILFVGESAGGSDEAGDSCFFFIRIEML